MRPRTHLKMQGGRVQPRRQNDSPSLPLHGCLACRVASPTAHPSQDAGGKPRQHKKRRRCNSTGVLPVGSPMRPRTRFKMLGGVCSRAGTKFRRRCRSKGVLRARPLACRTCALPCKHKNHSGCRERPPRSACRSVRYLRGQLRVRSIAEEPSRRLWRHCRRCRRAKAGRVRASASRKCPGGNGGGRTSPWAMGQYRRNRRRTC